MVIFHSYVKLPEGTNVSYKKKTWKFHEILFFATWDPTFLTKYSLVGAIDATWVVSSPYWSIESHSFYVIPSA